MDTGKHSTAILNVTKHLGTISILPENKLEIFSFLINSNEFNYRNACEQLLESVLEFSLSRKYRKTYKSESMKLSKEARIRFKDWKEQTGELGEFLLFCFLEGHLKAPKILSKFELKTSNKMHVHGSDGIHYIKVAENKYQLLFGESKLYKDLTSGFRDAFKSVHDFKYEENGMGDKKSGIAFEKSLISANMESETFSENEKMFLRSLLYPTSHDEAPEVDDAFGIFIGFEISDCSEQKKTMSNSDFRDFIYKEVLDQVSNKKEQIQKYINKNKLQGHTFYIYILPFEKIDEDKAMMLKELVG